MEEARTVDAGLFLLGLREEQLGSATAFLLSAWARIWALPVWEPGAKQRGTQAQASVPDAKQHALQVQAWVPDGMRRAFQAWVPDATRRGSQAWELALCEKLDAAPDAILRGSPEPGGIPRAASGPAWLPREFPAFLASTKGSDETRASQGVGPDETQESRALRGATQGLCAFQDERLECGFPVLNASPDALQGFAFQVWSEFPDGPQGCGSPELCAFQDAPRGYAFQALCGIQNARLEYELPGSRGSPAAPRECVLQALRESQYAAQPACEFQAVRQPLCGFQKAAGLQPWCADGRRWPWRKRSCRREQRPCAASARWLPRCGAGFRQRVPAVSPHAGCRQGRRYRPHGWN